jgi:hypothetical protein
VNLYRITTVAALFLASAGIAHATRNPTPPPSGVVIHLFGPNGILSNATSHLPGESPAPPAPGQNPGSPPGAASSASTAGSNNSMSTSDDPSWGSIFHQMFVVGDPSHPNQPAPGRPAEREPIPVSN